MKDSAIPVILAKLFLSYMNLEQEQVLIYNQKFKLPPDKGLFISIALLAEKPFGTNKKYKTNPDLADPSLALVEVVSVNRQETYSVQIYSKDESALERKDEIIAALTSDLAQSAAEKYAFKLGQQPVSMVDASAVEGGARLNRYVATFNVLSVTQTERAVPYYDKFTNPPDTILINA